MAENTAGKKDIPTTAVITGGAGFIGTHLARRLLSLGCTVTTLDIAPRSDQLEVSHQIWDVRKPLPKDLVDAPDVIFNLAAIHRTPGHPDREYYETNVSGAMNVCKWAEEIGTKTICFTSSISVYGPSEDTKYESTAPAPVSPYGISKLMAERIHETWVQQDESRSLKVIRPAVIFGENEHGNFTRLAQALRQRRFFFPGRDDTLKACGYVGDLVEAMCFCLSSQASFSIYNFCYAEPYSIRDVCLAFHEIAGYPLPKTIPRTLISAPLKVADRLDVEFISKHARRIQKLEVSTNIQPRALIEAGFKWETDLHSGIQKWHLACGFGTFH